MTRRAGPGRGRQARAAGALYGLAIGDALGMPTESLPRPQMVARYGPLLDWFQPGAADQPLAPGLAAGTVTDDTEQALLLAGLLIEGGGRIDAAEFARQLLAWEESMRAARLAQPARPVHQAGPGRAAGRRGPRRDRPVRQHQRRGHADHPGRRGHTGR